MIIHFPGGQAEPPIPTGNSLATAYPYESRPQGLMAQASPNLQSARSRPQLLSFLIGTACSGWDSLAADPYATAFCDQLGSRQADVPSTQRRATPVPRAPARQFAPSCTIAQSESPPAA